MTRRKSLIVTFIVYLVSLVIGYFVYVLTKNSMSMLFSTLIANICMTLIVFFVSVAIDNSSLYDPYWSVIPIFIVLLWAIETDFNLVSVMAIIGVSIWGLRLTFNWFTDFEGFAHEDFRYVDFRKKFPRTYWLVSLMGIQMFPTLIVYLSLYPIYFTFINQTNGFLIPIIGTLVMILGATISFYADKELRKHKRSSKSTSVSTGLWKYSRHPNYFGELLFWFGCFVYSLSSGVDLFTPLGIIGMILLFNLYSVPKMEKKLLGNKEDYAGIIEKTPRLFIRPIKK